MIYRWSSQFNYSIINTDYWFSMLGYVCTKKEERLSLNSACPHCHGLSRLRILLLGHLYCWELFWPGDFLLWRSKLDYMKCNFLIRRRFRSLLVRSELSRINMRYQELFKKTADITDEGETICISLSLNNRIFIVF